MAYRWQGRFFEVDPDNPAAEGICYRCGFRFNLKNLVWQYDFRGSTTLQNTRVLVCTRDSCLDVPNPQTSPIILGPDPPPIFNASVEPYSIDESNFLVTDDNSIITTDADVPFISSEPNPDSNAAAANLTAALSYPSGTVTSVFLDLFDGNPLTTGRSILLAVTGSATRTDIGPSLTVNGSNVAENTDLLSVVSASLATVNVSYVGLYSAASGGVLRTSGPVGSSMTITQNQPIQFPGLGLTINLN